MALSWETRTNPRYSDYPVVGVTWQAAKVYAKVRSMYKNKALEERGLAPQPNYRLPTAAEWEYAAKGGIENAQYPWDGPFTRDSQGHILANFQSKVGDYSECGYTYPSPVRSFPPNKYGLYDMAGNVAEWCEDNYSPFLAKVSCVVNPVYRDSKTDFRVIKGGSWKDVSYSIQTGVLDAVWWAFPIAELVSLILSALFLIHVKRTKINPLSEEHA